MQSYSLRRQLGYSFLLFTLLLLLVPRVGHDGDLHYWFTWATYIFEHGLGNVYQVPNNNYNPLYHYILWMFGQLAGSSANIDYYRHWLKAFFLVFDFAGAFWAASLVKEKERRFGLVLLLLFNIGYLYNTLVWVQMDTIYTCFAFGAVVLAVRQRAVLSMLCFVVAIAAKTQAIIFLPPLLLLWVPLWWYRPWRLVWTVIAGTALTILILAPFIWWSWENYVPRIIEINLGVTEVFPKLAVGAYNSWYILTPNLNPLDTDDKLLFGNLTYRTWGLLMFFTFSAVALFPLLLVAVRNLRSPLGKIPSAAPEATHDLAVALLSCGLIPLLFCYFNTQMHERYWHAAVLFSAAYGFIRREYVLFILVSTAYFLNLEGVLHFLKLREYSLFVFTPSFVASLFGLAILVGLAKLYWLIAWRTDWAIIKRGAISTRISSAGPVITSSHSSV